MGINNSLNYQPVQYNVVVGAANNAIANVAPSSTSGYPLVSQGASSNPTFAQATVPGGGTGTGSFVAYTPVTGGTTTTGALQSVASAGSSGQALISGGASALPAYGVLGIAGGGTNASSFTQSNGIVTYNGTSLVNYAGPQINSSGRMTNTAQPCFLAKLSTSVTNATGNGNGWQLGTTTALTIIYDNTSSMNTNGTFTAPVTGRYLLSFVGSVTNCTIAAQVYFSIETTSAIYLHHTGRTASSADWGWTNSVIVNMSASDTALFFIQVIGESGNTNTILGSSADPVTYVSGHLVC